jgi:deoxyribonuclease (pyrimidine dimer)
MTRINCIPVSELTDKHLVAEYRELPRVSKLARPTPCSATYTLGKGHVIFFYNKGAWLKHRFEQEIVPEMQRRGFVTNFTTYREHPEGLNGDWAPDEDAMRLNRHRIHERLNNGKE